MTFEEFHTGKKHSLFNRLDDETEAHFNYLVEKHGN